MFLSTLHKSRASQRLPLRPIQSSSLSIQWIEPKDKRDTYSIIQNEIKNSVTELENIFTNIKQTFHYIRKREIKQNIPIDWNIPSLNLTSFGDWNSYLFDTISSNIAYLKIVKMKPELKPKNLKRYIRALQSEIGEYLFFLKLLEKRLNQYDNRTLTQKSKSIPKLQRSRTIRI